MITVKLNQLEAICKDYTKIENYDKAIADKEYKWEPHHRLESHFSDGTSRGIPNNFLLKDELIALDMYYDRPPEEIIFIRYDEHRRLHFKGLIRGKQSEEHKAKLAIARTEAAKRGAYKNNRFHKRAQIKGKHWATNGIEDRFVDELPDETWHYGRTKIRNRKQSEEERKKRSESAKKRTDYHSFTLTDQQKQNLSNAMKAYYGGIK